MLKSIPLVEITTVLIRKEVPVAREACQSRMPVPSAQADAAPDDPDEEADAEAVSVSESSAGEPSEVPNEHYLMHTPKHPKCDVCQGAKMQNRHCRRKGKEIAYSDRRSAEKFGDLSTADRFFSCDGVIVDGDVLGVFARDAFTSWLACYPAAENSADEARFAFNDFVGPKEKVGTFYSDCATELLAAAKRLR
jgi:hypothetical protein